MKETLPIKILPSVLAADWAHLADEVQRATEAGADGLQLDIMDGHFVNNISFGPAFVAAVNRSTDLYLDVHLMIYNPYDYIERFVEAGADSITIHFEATEDIQDTLDFIHRCNIKAGLAFRPETSESLIVKYLNKVDLVLVMTVEPGFGGQAFMPETLEKVRFTREMCDRLRIREGGQMVEEGTPLDTIPPLDIQVDGGINLETARRAYQAGANSFVVGSYLFPQGNMKDRIALLREMGSVRCEL